MDALIRAGEAALRSGALAVAAQRLERAVALAGKRAGPPVLLLLGEALMAEGRGERAVAAYERLLRHPDLLPDTAAEAQRMLGRALFLAGEVFQAERRLEVAAAMSEEADDPEPAVQALLDLSRAAWLTSGPARALPAAAQARATARLAGESARLQADAAWGFVSFVAGDPAGLEATVAAAQGAEPDEASVLRDLAWNWGTLRNTGRAAKYAERFPEAEAVFGAMFGQAQRSGSPHAIASLAAHHADTLARQGRLAEAAPLVATAVSLGELAPMAAAFAHAVEATLLLHAGRPAEAEEACNRAEQVATAHGQWLPLLRVWQLRAVRHAEAGDLDEACALYARLESETARLGIGEPCVVPWARRAAVSLVVAGRVGQAERVHGWLEACAPRLPCRWPRIAAHVAAAAVAEWRGDPETAESRLRSALVLHGEVPLPLEHVETLLHWGAFLRRSGRVVEGRRALREALALAEQAGSSWLAGRVEEELTVAGGRRRSARAPDTLTPQEQRVAELAGSGRSSREIASHLSLSIRTIETHLHRVYGKLGIHSQRELMARFGAQAHAEPRPRGQRRIIT